MGKLAGQSLFCFNQDRGKSGLQRAGCRLMTGRREAMESATENIPPLQLICIGKGEMVSHVNG